MLLQKQSVNKFKHKKVIRQRDMFLEFFALRSSLLLLDSEVPYIESREKVTVVR